MKLRKSISALCFLALLGTWGCSAKDRVDPARKVLNVSSESDVKGFDPIALTDLYSVTALELVYEPLLQFHYLKRPYEVVSLLTEALPTVSKDLRTYTFRLRDHIYFHDDPAFGGKPRKLVAKDVVYSLLRVADPAKKSPNWWMLEDRVEGLDEFRKQLLESKGTKTYDSIPVSGFSAPDERTFVIKLKKPYRQLLFALTMPQFGIVAREVVEKYGDDFLNHPVGTGPFLLKEWRRGQRLIFGRNTKYWGDVYPTEGDKGDAALGLLASAGKKLPFVDELRFWVYVETQPLWLNLLSGNLDFAGIPKESYDSVYDKKGEIKADIRRRRMSVMKTQGVDTVFFVFNTEDPLFAKNKYLRQAISAALNREEKFRLFYNNRVVEAAGPIPPGFFGYDGLLKNPYGYNLDLAKRLIAKAREQYRANGGKGELPPIIYDTVTDTTHRQISEALAHDLSEIGLKIEIRPETWPQFQDRVRKRQVQFAMYAWTADYPDPENFLQLFYSRNAAPGPNYSNFRNDKYDRMYEKVRDMEDGPERLKLIREMVSLLQEEVPAVFFNHRILYRMSHTWVRNLKMNPVNPGLFKFVDIDLGEKSKTLPLLK